MRPSWRLDAKWLFGLACLAAIVVACFSYSVYRLTAHGPATGTAAAVIQAMTRQALDDDFFAKLKQAAQASPQAEVQAEGVTIPLRGEEIAGLTKEEVVKEAATRLADILYYEGMEAGEAYFQDLTPGEPPPEGEASEKEDEGLQLEILGLLTKGSHDAVRPFVLGLSLGASALLAILALLSRGPGRLGSPSVALVVAVAPFALATTLLRGVLKDGQESSEAALADAAAAIYPTIDDLSRQFTVFVAIGAALVAVAVCGHIATWAVARWRRRQPQAEADRTAEPAIGSAPLETAVEEDLPVQSEEFPSIGPGGVPQA